MEPENKLEAILLATSATAGVREDIVAIVAAVQWIAEHDCPDGFGTYWHERCQKLVQPC